MGGYDPCLRIAHGSFWWATGRPTVRPPCPCGGTAPTAGHRLRPGAPNGCWTGPTPSRGCGTMSPVRGVRAAHPLVTSLPAGTRVRLAAIGRVFHRLLRAIFEQLVTGKEAYRAYAATVRHFHAAAGSEAGPGTAAR